MIDEIDQKILSTEHLLNHGEKPLSGISCVLVGVGFVIFLVAALITVRFFG